MALLGDERWEPVREFNLDPFRCDPLMENTRGGRISQLRIISTSSWGWAPEKGNLITQKFLLAIRMNFELEKKDLTAAALFPWK